MYNREKYMNLLAEMLEDNINYPFNGKQEVSSVNEFAHRVLSHAERLYTDEYYYRDYPEFKDFLYSYHVDTIAYDVYTGDLN